MISAKDLYVVLSAVVPLYVAMILAYGSVRWWKILTPQQCGGINRFVAIFAVPLLSFHIIANNNPYTMNAKFVLADAIQKFAILIPLGIWARFSKRGSIEWMITLFMLATLPNTLVMGIPLLAAMYGTDSGSLVVQAVVLQCIIWYTMLLFFYEYRSARILISDQFPETAASIISFKVESDVMSLDGREPLQTEAEIGDDGKIHVTVRRSISSSSYAMLSPRRSTGLASMPSSKALTPRPSNMTGAEIYSIHSSRNMTPRESSFNHNDFYSMMGGKPMGSPRHSNFTHSDIYSLHSSRGPTPRTSNFAEEKDSSAYSRGPNVGNSPRFPPPIYFRRDGSGIDGNNVWAGNQGNNLSPKHPVKREADLRSSPKMSDDPKDLHMFVWSSNASPAPEGFGGPDFGAIKQDSVVLTIDQTVPRSRQNYDDYDRDDFSFGNRASFRGDESLSTTDKDGPSLTKMGSSSTAELAPKLHDHKHEMPPATVMTKLIFNMVCRKLIRNPNTYSSLIGLTWALVSYRWHVNMPTIVEKSILILSSAGLGMAMFSLGLFMALQQRLLACGTSLAIFGMAVRFVTGPAVMAASSIAVGLRGVDLHVSIVQAALPQGIVPFVFAKEYNVHPDVLSTAVIFGMLVSFPITLLYYVLLGL